MPGREWLKRIPLYITEDERTRYFTTKLCNDIFARLIKTKVNATFIYSSDIVTPNALKAIEKVFNDEYKEFSDSIVFVEEPISQISHTMKIIIDSGSKTMYEDNKHLFSEFEQKYILEKLKTIHK